jgi:hypothetical protein
MMEEKRYAACESMQDFYPAKFPEIPEGRQG